MKTIASLVGVLALLVLFPLSGHAAPVGKVTYVKGRVDITGPDRVAKPLRLGDVVNAGDIIRTKSKSRVEVTFTDGNILRLARKSRLEISEYVIQKGRTGTTLKLFRGKAQSILKRWAVRLSDLKMQNRYEIHTPTAVCGVRGTNFFAYYQQGLSGFICKEGSLYGYSINRPDEIRNIKAGQALLVVRPDLPPDPRPNGFKL